MPLAGTYRPRQPEHTAFYPCLEDYWEEFKEAYPYFYEKDHFGAFFGRFTLFPTTQSKRNFRLIAC